MCFSFLRFTACVTVEEVRVLMCLADRRWGSWEEGRGEGPICDDDIDDDEVEGMEEAATKALARRGAPLQRRALDAVAAAAGDVQLPCTPLTARICKFSRAKKREREKKKKEMGKKGRVKVRKDKPPSGDTRPKRNPALSSSFFDQEKKKAEHMSSRAARAPPPLPPSEAAQPRIAAASTTTKQQQQPLQQQATEGITAG